MDDLMTVGLVIFFATIGLVLVAIGLWLRIPVESFESRLARFLVNFFAHSARAISGRLRPRA